MSSSLPTLHLLCGKIASGKSTLSARLAKAPGTIVIAEDDWLSALFAAELHDGADYLRCAGLLRAAMAPHVVALLKAGTSVVLDFQANTVASRQWMRTIADQARTEPLLHWLDTPDALCLARLKARNAAGTHAFAVSEAQFHRFGAHFVPPSEFEGFTIQRHVPHV